MRAFTQAASKEDYIYECKDKLASIRHQRAEQQYNSFMQTQALMQQNNFNQQWAPNMQQTPTTQGQVTVQSNTSSTQPPDSLSDENNRIINRRIAELVKRTPGEQKRSIVETMSPPLRAALENAGVDLINYHFRLVATREFWREENERNLMGIQSGQQRQLTNLLSHEEDHINFRAAQLAKSTPKEKSRSVVEGMEPSLRPSLEARNIDPSIYHFRMIAAKELHEQNMLREYQPGQKVRLLSPT